jgi:hypothetical protein
MMFAFVCFTAFGHCNVCEGKHHNGQKPQAKQRQASQWPKAVNQRKANITMAKSRKTKNHCNVCLCLVYGFWPL